MSIISPVLLTIKKLKWQLFYLFLMWSHLIIDIWIIFFIFVKISKISLWFWLQLIFWSDVQIFIIRRLFQTVTISFRICKVLVHSIVLFVSFISFFLEIIYFLLKFILNVIESFNLFRIVSICLNIMIIKINYLSSLFHILIIWLKYPICFFFFKFFFLLFF